MSAGSEELPQLGSLAQAARNKHIRRARTTLIVIGILMALGQTAMYFYERGQLRAELEKEVRRQLPGAAIDEQAMKEFEESAQRALLLIEGGVIAVAISFIVMGFFVEKYPVPITALALIMYIGLHVTFAVIDPRNIAMGLIVKIIVIVFLVRALQAGIAAQKESQAGVEYGG